MNTSAQVVVAQRCEETLQPAVAVLIQKNNIDNPKEKLSLRNDLLTHNDSLVAELIAEPRAKTGDRPVQELRKRVGSTEPRFQDCDATSCCLVRLHKGPTSYRFPLTSSAQVVTAQQCGGNRQPAGAVRLQKNESKR